MSYSLVNDAMTFVGRSLKNSLLTKQRQQVVPADPTRHFETSLFEFYMPWPWDTINPGLEGIDNDQELEGIASAPRTDGDLAIFRVWYRPMNWAMNSVKPNQLKAELARVNNGRDARLERVLVGGVNGFLVGMTIPGDALLLYLEIPSPRHNTLVEGVFQAPGRQAQGYLTHLDTMLATWRWR